LLATLAASVQSAFISAGRRSVVPHCESSFLDEPAGVGSKKTCVIEAALAAVFTP
jgi:hypothetical protein